jgi:hypothetical protein
MAAIEDIACGNCGAVISTTSYGKLITQMMMTPLFEQRAFKDWTPWRRTNQRCPHCERTNFLYWYLGEQNQGDDFNKGG